MKLSKTLLATSIISIFALSGCGGSDDESSNSFSKTIRVIDGYLSEAEICIDENKNGICETSEKAGFTKEDGSFSLTEKQLNAPIIANVISGKTKDSDISGLPVLQSYSMYSSGQESVVTPFTTLAKIKNISISDLASELDLPENAVAGDYIELKKNDPNGIKAHYIARALAAAKMPNDINIINDILDESKKRILNSVNDNTLDDLDNKLLIIDGDGKFVEKEQIKNLEQHLVKKDNWHNGSLNSHYLDEDGIKKVSFKDGLMNIHHDNGGVEEFVEYEIEDNKLYAIVDNNKIEIYEYIYTSDKLLLSLTEDVGDIIFWTEDDLSGSFSASDMKEDMFKGKTWYYLADDSTDNKPRTVLIELEFSKDDNKSVLIKEGDETKNATWSIISETDEFGTHANLKIDLQESNEPMSLMLVTDANELLLTSEIASNGQFSILTENKDIAQGIKDIVFDFIEDPDIEVPPVETCENPMLWDGPISIQYILDAGRNTVISFADVSGAMPDGYIHFNYDFVSDELGINVEDLENGDIFTYSGEPKEGYIGMNSTIGHSNVFDDPIKFTTKVTLPNGDVITDKFVYSMDDKSVPSISLSISDCQATGYYDFDIDYFE